ncbi:MAG: YdcF family protein [Planctomycetota bacterium]
MHRLIDPFSLAMLCLVVGTVVLWRQKLSRRVRVLLTVPPVLLLLVCMPAVTFVARGSLEWRYMPQPEIGQEAGAIVILSGYVFPASEIRPQPLLAGDTLYRCLEGLRLYRECGSRRIVVSGGRYDDRHSERTLADEMAQFLIQQGVASGDVLCEGRSQNTHENAKYTAQLLANHGVHRVALVTDALHLRRAIACFEKQGIRVVPCGCAFGSRLFTPELYWFLPDPRAAASLGEVVREWVAIIVYWWRGWI